MSQQRLMWTAIAECGRAPTVVCQAKYDVATLVQECWSGPLPFFQGPPTVCSCVTAHFSKGFCLGLPTVGQPSTARPLTRVLEQQQRETAIEPDHLAPTGSLQCCRPGVGGELVSLSGMRGHCPRGVSDSWYC
jgi:hypothetical protein